jgi:hypothetical protein
MKHRSNGEAAEVDIEEKKEEGTYFSKLDEPKEPHSSRLKRVEMKPKAARRLQKEISMEKSVPILKIILIMKKEK